MKVLHVIPSIAPIRGGPSQAVLAMVHALRLQGVDAEIATTNDNGPELLNVPLHQLTAYPLQRGNVPVRFFPRFSPAVASLREFAVSASLTSWLRHHLKNYDRIHVHAIFSYPSTAAMLLARTQGIPYIVRPLGQLCQWSLQQGKHKKQLYLDLIEQANLQGSLALHFTSTQEQGEARSLGFTQSSFVAPHGLDLPDLIPDAARKLREVLSIPDNNPIITFMSRLHPKKGLDKLILALGALKRESFHFVIAGEGTPEYVAEMNQLLIQAGIQNRTHQLGFVEGKQKDLLLQGSNLFVLTSHSENFGIAVLEALAAGLPTLVTPGVALASVVQAHQLGWVVEQEPAAIAQALQHALQDSTLKTVKGDRARQVVQQQFGWKRVASSIIQQYETLPQSFLLNSEV